MLEEIIEFCDKNNITPYSLAKNIALSELAIRNILNGKTAKPRINNIRLIHDFLFKKESPSLEPIERKSKSGYDLKIESARAEILELENLVNLLSQELSSVNKETALDFKTKIESYKAKSRLLEERIEIITLAKNNQKEEN